MPCIKQAIVLHKAMNKAFRKKACNTMQIELNGTAHITKATSLLDLLVELQLSDGVVATALNGQFVPMDHRAATPLQSGDRVEVLSPMQGG